MQETLIDARQRWLPDFRELWHFRDLLAVMLRRDIAVRYKQTALGPAWALLQPLITVLIYTLIFGRLAKLPSDGHPYPLFVLSGLLPWLFFSTLLTGATHSVVAQSRLITKVYFPRLAAPYTAIGRPLMDFSIALLLLFGLMAWYRHVPPLAAATLPLWLLGIALTGLGIGSALAALAVFWRDVLFMVGIAVNFLLFLTPVIYPARMLPAPWDRLLLLNPLTGLIESARACLLGTPIPWHAGLASLAAGAVLFFAGSALFQRLEPRFADVI